MPRDTRLQDQALVVQRAQRDFIRALVAIQTNDADTLEEVLSYVGFAANGYNNTQRFANDLEEYLPNLFNNNVRQAAQTLIEALRTLGAIADDQREQRRSRRK